MTCVHGIESGACKACDKAVLSRASHDSTTDLGWGIRLAARLRTVELWDEKNIAKSQGEDMGRQTRIMHLRAAIDGVLRKMGLLEESK